MLYSSRRRGEIGGGMSYRQLCRTRWNARALHITRKIMAHWFSDKIKEINVSHIGSLLLFAVDRAMRMITKVLHYFATRYMRLPLA